VPPTAIPSRGTTAPTSYAPLIATPVRVGKFIRFRGFSMRISFLAAAIAAVLCGTAHAQVTFMPLQTQGAQLTKISGNGLYATGKVGIDGALRWTVFNTPQEEVITGLASSGGINNWGSLSVSVPVNGGTSGGGTDLGAYIPTWNNNVPVPFTSTLSDNSSAWDIADDGTMIGTSADQFFITGNAYVWTPANGMSLLPVNRPGNYSRADKISADGRTIIGFNDQDTGQRTAVVWQNGVVTDLVDAAGTPLSSADGVSSNGRFVVGEYYTDAAGNQGGWRWDAQTGEVLAIPGMAFARAVSDDGKTIVGVTDTFAFPARAAMIWREGIGTEPLVNFLADNGVSIPANWDPNLAGSFTAISGDGLLMGGWTADITTFTVQSYLIQIVPVIDDTIFEDGFDGQTP
jgi:uncharacterized membrane protein